MKEIIGWSGAAAILLAYALVSFNIITAHDITYQVLNIAGAIGIVIISLKKKAYQPAALNIVWAIIGIIALTNLAL